MKEYEYKGEKYIFDGKRWLMSNYLVAPMNVVPKLNELLANDIDIENMTYDELIQFAAKIKQGENNTLAARVFRTVIETSNNSSHIRNALPRYTSVLRKMGQYDEAIRIGELMLQKHGRSVESPALFTSLGGAYVDSGDYITGRKYANKARAISGATSSPELISLYARIKKMDGGK